jgi:hypothetical protein
MKNKEIGINKVHSYKNISNIPVLGKLKGESLAREGIHLLSFYNLIDVFKY